MRFRGYGQNKIIHLTHLNYSGYTFRVHPGAWLVHRSHGTTPAKLQHATDFVYRHSRSADQWKVGCCFVCVCGGGGGGTCSTRRTLCTATHVARTSGRWAAAGGCVCV